MNLPNLLTLGRLIASLGFVFLLDRAVVEHHGRPALLIAAAVFALASFTDFLDGYLARKWNQITNFGKLFDPLADKILVGSAFILLAALQLMPGWAAALLIAREFLVTGLRGLAASTGLVLPADHLGKIKTVVHMATILATLLLAEVHQAPELFPQADGSQTLDLATTFTLPGPAAGWWAAWIACLLLSWWSGFQYLWASRNLLTESSSAAK